MQKRPNILIFMTDQQRGGTVLAGAREKAITPNLDRFREQGVTFSETFCPSPHCCPSRATFMSGLYPSQHGVWNNVSVGNTLSRGLFDGVRLWSEDLAASGYRMDYSGKWHVSDREGPIDRGWRGNFGAQGRGRELPNRPMTAAWQWYEDANMKSAEDPRGEAELPREGYPLYTHYGESEDPFRDRQVTDDAVRIIRERAKSDQPWCQYVGTLGPHDAYFPPQAFLDWYKLEDVDLPPSFEDSMGDKPGFYRRTRDTFAALTEREHREAIRHYLAFCSFEDYLFGQILDALEASGEAENTVVIYVSDHGDYMGDHRLWCKGLPCFRGAYHVPNVIRWPAGIASPGRTVDALVSLADFAPTFLELAGCDIPEQVVGQSLLPFLRDETPAEWREAIFTQSNGNELYGIQRAVMTRDWKYVYNGFDYDELYDLRNDPEEITNLATDPQQKPRIRELATRMWQFARRTDDVCVNPYIMVRFAPVGPGVALRD